MKGYILYQRNKAYLKNAMICTGDKLYVSEVLGHALTISSLDYATRCFTRLL